VPDISRAATLFASEIKFGRLDTRTACQPNGCENTAVDDAVRAAVALPVGKGGLWKPGSDGRRSSPLSSPQSCPFRALLVRSAGLEGRALFRQQTSPFTGLTAVPASLWPVGGRDRGRCSKRGLPR
jgi:hypothetical protein